MTVCIVSTDISLSLTIGQLGVSDLARAVWCERELFIPGWRSKMAASLGRDRTDRRRGAVRGLCRDHVREREAPLTQIQSRTTLHLHYEHLIRSL